MYTFVRGSPSSFLMLPSFTYFVLVWPQDDLLWAETLLLLLLLLLTAIGLSPGGSDYCTCIQNMKLVTNKFKSGGLHEKHVVATWNVGNHLSICL